jgi:hypothetical protein
MADFLAAGSTTDEHRQIHRLFRQHGTEVDSRLPSYKDGK